MTRHIELLLVLAGILTMSLSSDGAERRARPGKAGGPDEPVSSPADFGPPGPKARKPTLFDLFNTAAVAFVGKVADVKYGPVAESYPPIYSLTIAFEEVEALRGNPGDKPRLSYRAHQVDKPVFPRGDKMLVAVEVQQGRMTIKTLVPADEKNVAEARRALAVPVGWSFRNGKCVSPWEKFGPNAWPAEAKLKGETVCSRTGRPALLAGQAVTLKAEPILPANVHEWKNPDGDGEFKVTVTNASDQPATVPALLAVGEGENQKILWSESLFALNAGQAFFLPGAGQVPPDVRAAVLQPRQSVSATVNTLRFPGVSWPRGGYRIHFQLCLGELSAEAQFYYLSKHHDPLREALKP